MAANRAIAECVFHVIKGLWKQWRFFRGVQSSVSAVPLNTAPRPEGKLLWFHVPSLGAASIVLPFVQKCLLFDRVYVLLTSCQAEIIQSISQEGLHPRVFAFHLVNSVIRSFGDFVQHWRPDVGVFLEDCVIGLEGVECLRSAGCRLVLFKARLQNDQFLSLYASNASRQNFQKVLSNFSIIIPVTQSDVGRFRMMGASLDQIPGWSLDLNWAAEIGEAAWALKKLDNDFIKSIKRRLSGRTLWMAVHVHKSEVPKLLTVQEKLRASCPKLLIVLVPDSARHCESTIKMLLDKSMHFAMWTPQTDECADDVEVLLLDPNQVEHLQVLTHIVDIVFVGSSLLPGMRGKSVAESCIANCAVVTGKFNEDYAQIAEDVNQSAVIAAEEAETAVYHSGVAHHSEESEDEEQSNTSRPANGMLHHLLSRRSSSPFSFVTETLMSSFPAQAERPQTAPPALREQGTRQLQTRLSHSASVQERPRTAEYEQRPHPYSSILEEDEENAACPGPPTSRSESTRRGGPSIFQINEEHYMFNETSLIQETSADVAEILHSSEEEHQGVEDLGFGDVGWTVPRPSPVSESGIRTEQCFTPDTLYTDSKSCSPFNAARHQSHVSAEVHHDLKVMSPSGEYVMPATHLPYGTTGPAVWTVQCEQELADVLLVLLTDHLQCRSRAHAASQGAARCAIGLVRTALLKEQEKMPVQGLEVWKVVFDHVIEQVVRND